MLVTAGSNVALKLCSCFSQGSRSLIVWRPNTQLSLVDNNEVADAIAVAELAKPAESSQAVHPGPLGAKWLKIIFVLWRDNKP